jgi:pyridoxamine 5'-phosphate oxidase
MRISDPILETFRKLLAEAQDAGDPEPTAMLLATAGGDGRVSARTVLLKAADARGFVFYTNTLSLKGRQLAVKPQAALTFLWKSLRHGVQVRIEGAVEPVDAAEADAYFASRPRGSQIGAWASRQSRAIERPGDLEARVEEFEKKFEGGAVPRPPHWSGFRLAPETIEFWKGKASRLHERQLYTRDGDGWRVQLLYP